MPFINDENLVVNTTITTTTITITTKSTTKATEKNDRNYKVQKNLADENVFISKYKFQCYFLHRLNFDFLIVPLSFKFIHSSAQVEILFDLRILFCVKSLFILSKHILGKSLIVNQSIFQTLFKLISRRSSTLKLN